MIKLSAILLVGILLITGCSNPVSSVDIEATVEAIVEATVEARSKQNTPTSTAVPSTSTIVPPTSTAVPPATAPRSPAITPVPLNSPTPTANKQQFDYMSREAIVTAVVDGDTVKVRFNDNSTDTVRLLGVDTPETSMPNKSYEYGSITDTKCLDRFGYIATVYAEEQLSGKNVVIALDETAGLRGSYGRLLAYIEVGGSDFNRSLVRLGYARVYDEGESVREAEYMEEQEFARSVPLGLWTCSSEVSSQPKYAPTVVPTPKTDYVIPENQPSARCKDGTYSYSKNRSGTCSWHGGVAEWLR